MKKGVWLGGLLLALGSGAANLSAQEVVWQTTGQPAPPASKASARPGPIAFLGQPIALPPDPGENEAPPNPRTAPGRRPAPYPFPPAFVRAQNPEVVADATSGQAQWQQASESGGKVGGDRGVVPAVWRGDAGQSRVIQTSLAGSPYPVAQPVEAFADPASIAGEEAVPTASFYLRGEYLLWRTKADQVPPLVTTSSNPNDFGFLGNPTTQVLFGGGNLDRNTSQGGRITAGYYLDECGQTALEVSGFILGQESARFMASSAQYPVIARPFFNLNQNQEFSQLVAFPGVSTGNVQINAPSRMWGAEANLRCNLCSDCNCKVDALGGFRYLDLNESITIQENLQGLAGAPAPFTNARTTVVDRFATHNQFYGGQVGLDAELRRGRWSLDLLGKVALGDTHQRLTIDGSEQIVAANGTVSNFRGGLLALPSNIGRYNRDRFSVVPEVGISLGYQLTEHLRLSVGYNFLYWTNVLRPGNQIDRVVDVTQIPNFNIAGVNPVGQNRPAVPFKESDFWAQGLTVGIEFRY
jgi:hypothetical protein